MYEPLLDNNTVTTLGKPFAAGQTMCIVCCVVVVALLRNMNASTVLQ